MSWLWVGLVACGRREPYAELDPDAAALSDYHMIEEGTSWIYRDDSGDSEPDEDTLLHARHEDGQTALRRGARWADGEAVGALEWETGDGLVLVGWSLPSGESGSGELLISGELIGIDPDGCTLTQPEEGLPTYYGTFSDVLLFECGEPLPSRLGFALGIGLVWLETEGDTLDLVAPW